MEIIAACHTDAGNIKEINQDSLSVKVVNTPKGKIAFAIVCDGMGGLEHGEVASKEVVMAFNNWFQREFAKIAATDTCTAELIQTQWEELIDRMNDRLAEYAKQKDMMMGTTVSALLVYQGKYYVCHVGDSRIYQIQKSVLQLTVDHTLVAKEVEMGKLTKEAALVDSRRNILLQCVGASASVEPQFEVGELLGDTVFLLCSDGFVHTISEKELWNAFKPAGIDAKEKLTKECEKMVNLVMKRGERDNVTVIALAVKQV